MAHGENAAAFQRSFSQEFLTCAICLEKYSEPRQLNCLHSYCTPCLADHIRKHRYANKEVFPCPLCMANNKIPDEGVLGFKIDFRLRSLMDYMNAEQRILGGESSGEKTPTAPPDILGNVSESVKMAKVKNKKMKTHIAKLEATEQELDSKYEDLSKLVSERGKQLCKIVYQLCQNYRETIEHDRRLMHAHYQEELKCTKESKFFLARCYKKFKQILETDEVPSKLVMLQLDTTVAHIFNEELQEPRWRIPSLDTVEDAQNDSYTIHSLLGGLVMDRRSPINKPDDDTLDDTMTPKDYVDTEDDAGFDTTDEIESESELDEEIESEDEDEDKTDQDNVSQAPSEISEQGSEESKSLKSTCKKKKKKRLSIGYKLLEQAKVLFVATPHFDSLGSA